MRSIWNVAISIFLLSVAVEKSNAALKNRTGEGYYFLIPSYGIPQWQGQSWMSQQPWIQGQGGIASQGWSLPPGGMPVPGWVPQPMQSIPPQPPYWAYIDDRNICTLDASILVVLENDGSVDNAQLPSHYGADGSSNAVRMPCSNIAIASNEVCTSCCKMACRQFTISLGDVHGFLINSEKINPALFQEMNTPVFQQTKQQGSSTPPGTPPPLPPVSCMCCGPRRSFSNWPAAAPNLPPQQM